MAGTQSQVQNAIEGYLTEIMNSHYGKEVCDNIVAALRKISEEIDTSLNNLDYLITGATQTISENSSQYEAYAQQAIDAAETLTDYQQTLTNIENALDRIRQIRSTQINYQPGPSGSGTWVLPTKLVDGEIKTYPMIQYEGGEWIYYTPPVPVFKEIRIDRSGSNTDAVSYDPSTGILDIKIWDPLSQLQVEANIYDNKRVQATDPLPAEIEYRNRIPYLRLFVPRGPDGNITANEFNYRPYIKKIYDNDETKDTNLSDPIHAFFGEKVLLGCNGRANHDISSGKIREYCMRDTAVPAFDAVIIVFRKSVNNTDTSNYKLEGTFNSGVKFDKNFDYKSTVTMILKRGETGIASMIDAAGRSIMRQVYWLDESARRYCWGGSRTAFPNTAIFRNSDAKPAGSVPVGPEYPAGGLLFGHTRVGDNGNLSEWAYHGSGNYQQTQHARTSAGAWKNPQSNANINKTCDQFLVPIQIYGVFQQLDEENINKFEAGK